uniref:Uncharacterized protein n=1 Tax=Rhipicephalus zambeziensis TaxID=60191 RepID=A0A224YG01_9ACAR
MATNMFLIKIHSKATISVRAAQYAGEAHTVCTLLTGKEPRDSHVKTHFMQIESSTLNDGQLCTFQQTYNIYSSMLQDSFQWLKRENECSDAEYLSASCFHTNN